MDRKRGKCQIRVRLKQQKLIPEKVVLTNRWYLNRVRVKWMLHELGRCMEEAEKKLMYPHDEAVSWVLKHFPDFSEEEIENAEEGYFGHPYALLRQVSSVCEDRIDAIAWDIHEIVESVLWHRSGRSPPNFKAKTQWGFKDEFHFPAVEAEKEFLRVHRQGEVKSND